MMPAPVSVQQRPARRTLRSIVGLYNAGVSEAAARVIVVAGALMQPLWVPAAELASRLARLSAMSDLQVAEADEAPRLPQALPRELAHDRWLRKLPAMRGVAIAPGAMSAVRQLARFHGDLSGWLLEPAHFHLAKDHLVLVAGATHDLTESDARQLADAVVPLLEEELFNLQVLGPATWLLTPREQPLQVESASFEAAAGRNVDGYLPTGNQARRYRKLLNEVQMSWHEHAVNQRREESGKLPINSIWLSGPVTWDALAAWREACEEGGCEIDETLLEARLRDDRQAWLDALQALDARLAECLTQSEPRAVLLCGDRDCRWLQRGSGVAGLRRMLQGGGMDSLARRLGSLLGALHSTRTDAARHRGPGGRADRLTAMFTEGAAGA